MMEAIHILAGIGYVLVGIYATGVGLVDLYSNVYARQWWAVPRSLIIFGSGIALLGTFR